jgi:hypothetical protein
MKLIEFYSHFKSYSFGNIMLILAQKPNATRCAGLRRWEKLGHKVRKGESAIWIRGPHFKEVEDPITKKVSLQLVNWLSLPVFDVSQLEGEVEIPKDRHPLAGDFEALYAHCVECIKAQGIDVIESKLVGAYGTWREGEIRIENSVSTSEKCLIIFHELAHAVLEHHNRHHELSQVERELAAESVSFIVAREFDMENPFSRDYLLQMGGTVEKLPEVLQEVYRATKSIMDMLKVRAQPLSVAAD